MICNIARAESTLPKCEGSKWYWTNCFGTTDYKEGNKNGIYEGEWKGAIRHGRGTYDDNAGSIYIGEWKFDERSGEGIQIYSDGSKYEGQWIDDLRSGEGIQIYPDGSKYEGQWIDDITTKQYNKHSRHRLIITIKNINYELLIPILLVVAITVLLKLFVKKFYNYLIVPIKKGLLLSNSMKGKASRTEYNIYFLFLILFLAFSMYCLFVISNFFPHLEMFGVYMFWYFVYAIFMLISGIAVTLRRLNDLKMGRSTIIVLFIPIIGLIFSLLLCILPSVTKKKKRKK